MEFYEGFVVFWKNLKQESDVNEFIILKLLFNKTLSSLRIKSLIIQVYIKFIAICMPVTKNYNVVFRLITAYTISIIYVKIIF